MFKKKHIAKPEFDCLQPNIKQLICCSIYRMKITDLFKTVFFI